MSRALLIIPPFIKYSAGPLLGPALLRSKAQQRGHDCFVLDLNAHFIRHHHPQRSVSRGNFVGDHDKPRDLSSRLLSEVEAKLFRQILSSRPICDLGQEEDDLRKIQFGFLNHDEMRLSAFNLASSSFGSWARDIIVDKYQHTPALVGLSLLHAGQVVPACAISMIARELWPETLVVWGGPHISGLGLAILDDILERRFAADLFITGHAEQTFASLLDKLSLPGSQFRSTGFEEGRRGNSVVPVFGDLDLYDSPPVLPAQSTLGCAYGRCKFCTYPVMEPRPTKLDLCLTVDSVVRKAQEYDGVTVALKDSLVSPQRLQEIGATIDGKVKWSAYTKLNKKLVDQDLLRRLASQGLATLEVGLESLLVDTQRRVAKVHDPYLFENFLSSVSGVPTLSIVVNYMTGFPWEDAGESHSKMQLAKQLIRQQLGDRGKLEHNRFELERLSPIARNPGEYNIDPDSLKFWPWASVVVYESNGK